MRQNHNMHPSVSFDLRQLLTRLSVAPLRMIAFALHATGLERIYKPRFARHQALIYLTDEVVAKLPKYCQTITGAKGDPINLIVVGREEDIRDKFRRSKWHRANPASPLHVMYGLYKALFKKSYQTGPFAPLYVNIGLQDLAFQHSERHHNFRQRHHLRLWRTGTVLPDGKRVWVGAAGRENGMRMALALPFWTHALDPDIDREREYVVRSVQRSGATRLKVVDMIKPIPAATPHKTVFGSQYYTDGRAVVIEF
jgi:hypothetical protein